MQLYNNLCDYLCPATVSRIQTQPSSVHRLHSGDVIQKVHHRIQPPTFEALPAGDTFLAPASKEISLQAVFSGGKSPATAA
jgi:hypothetical protein